VVSVKRSTAGASAAPFKVEPKKKNDKRLRVVLELEPLRDETFQATPTKQDLGTLSRVIFKQSSLMMIKLTKFNTQQIHLFAPCLTKKTKSSSFNNEQK